ncbi:unnamed protein product [Medioppia subpectinata]|uniref:Uncharacterized protein n=1 Tax=Medioppia subpectinata TaxID=1979941 RepID=A0A7R9Q6I2_9ACAR|nr:unnamed protein product [Medioppia subpectinata]CAG2113886.1 unnamed protein product [Medioppia subpectinata]
MHFIDSNTCGDNQKVFIVNCIDSLFPKPIYS